MDLHPSQLVFRALYLGVRVRLGSLTIQLAHDEQGSPILAVVGHKLDDQGNKTEELLLPLEWSLNDFFLVCEERLTAEDLEQIQADISRQKILIKMTLPSRG